MMRVSVILGLIGLTTLDLQAQKVSLIFAPTYGFGAGTIMPEAGARNSNGATSQGWQLGMAYDGLSDTVVHCRVRLAWQRNYWSEDYTGIASRWNDFRFQFDDIQNIGTAESRIDLVTITPLWVIPIGRRFRALFGADLSLILNSRVHHNSVSTFSVPYYQDGNWVEQLHTDSIGSGMGYLNQYQLAVPVGVEVDVFQHWRISAELSVAVSKFTNGSPARYGRLVISRRIGD